MNLPGLGEQPQGVEVGRPVAVELIGADEVRYAKGVGGGGAHEAGRGGGRGLDRRERLKGSTVHRNAGLNVLKVSLPSVQDVLCSFLCVVRVWVVGL